MIKNYNEFLKENQTIGEEIEKLAKDNDFP
jgi:hypothetical protein